MADGKDEDIDFQADSEAPATPKKEVGKDEIDFQPETETPPTYTDLSQESNLRQAPFDILKGAGKGALNTAIGIGKLAVPDWAVGPKASAKAEQTRQSLTTPANTMQKLGYGGEQVGEFLLPGGAEEKGATELATHLPMLGKLAEPTARLATSALGTGIVNKAQGGSFTGGAAMGAGSGALGEASRALAPSLAESALGVTRKMRGFGKTPGRAALEETTGIRPGTIADQAQTALRNLTGELETRANASQMPTSTVPAIRVIDNEQVKAIRQNNETRYNMLHDLRQQLTKEFSTGNPIPRQVPPSKILDLKRGIGDLETSWNPELRSGIKPVIRKVYGALDNELDQAVPEADKLNQRISSLIPVAQRGKSVAEGAEMPQRIAHRLAAHTGALAGTGLGSYLGYERGGAPGALVGGALGLAVPEILASPTSQMLGARALRSPTLPRIGRGLAAQLLKRSNEPENPDEE